jgi:hypothetical protein
MIILGWLFLLGICIDFFTVIITGENMDTPDEWIIILSYIWVTPATLPVFYVGTEIIVPREKKILKWIILSFTFILYVTFDVVLIIDPIGSIGYILPNKLGEGLIDDVIILGSPLSIIGIIMSPIYLIFCGFGFLIKSYQSTGVIRKKFLLISIGIVMLSTCIVFEGFFPLGLAMIFVRIGFLVSAFCWFFALREESAESKKSKPKKEVKVKESLFRLTERPDQFTEEEVTFHKEKKICLVCKGKVTRLMYTCPGCDALYCAKCSEALSNSENACWVCNTPFDESKPSKPYEKEEVVIEFEVSKSQEEKGKKS